MIRSCRAVGRRRVFCAGCAGRDSRPGSSVARRSARADRPRRSVIAGARELSDDVVRRCRGRRGGRAAGRTADRRRGSRSRETSGRNTATRATRSRARTASFDAGIRRADARRSTRGRSTASSSKASTRSSRARSPSEFALRAGDVFNRERARQALDACCGRRAARSVRAASTATHRRSRRQRDTRRGAAPSISSIATASASCSSVCASRRGASRCVPDLGRARGLVHRRSTASCRRSACGVAVFDHERFNHAFVAGPPVATRSRPSAPATALGFERPFFGAASCMSAASCTI